MRIRTRPTAAAVGLSVFTACAAVPDVPSIVSDQLFPSAPERTIEVVGAPEGTSGDINASLQTLREQYEADGGNPTYVNDAAYEAELQLQANGYPFARVEDRIDPSGLATLTVKAGGRATLGEVTVEAAPGCPLSDEDLAGYIGGPRTGLFGTGDTLYVERSLRGAPADIEADLEELGFLDARARLVDPGPLPEGGPVNLTLEVTAGERYRVGTVEVVVEPGDSDPVDAEPSAGRFAELEAAIAAQVQSAAGPQDGDPRPYSRSILRALRGSVTDTMAQRGHPDATVEITTAIERDGHRVNLSVAAAPGPYVVVEAVTFVGDDRTRPSFLMSRLNFAEGVPYDALKLREGVRSLYRTGLFAEVTPSLVGEGSMRQLQVDLVEQPSLEVFAEPGYGSYELARATVGARDRNLFGTGVSASTNATIAVRAARADLSFSDPWFLKRELLGDLRLEFDRREEPSFVRESRGFGAFVTKEWTPQTSTTIGYGFKRSEAKDIEVVDADVLSAQETVNISAVALSQRYDRRDALFAPSRGLYAEGSVELGTEGIGSELDFVRFKVSAAWFHPLGPDSVLGVGLRGGVIAPAFQENEIPLQERFFAGGENSVRSFLESRLGPVDAGGEALGGEAFTTLSLEWRRELAGPFQGALFTDAGFVESEASDALALDDVRLGVGAGLRYLLPIGPLRVDAAFNPDRRSGEDEWVVHFSIGMPF